MILRGDTLRRRPAPALPPLAMLDLSKPGEKQAHDFLVRATSGRERMWSLFELRRLGSLLLCSVRWVWPDDVAKPFALAEVNLIAVAVSWRDYATAELTRDELARRCDASLPAT